MDCTHNRWEAGDWKACKLVILAAQGEDVAAVVAQLTAIYNWKSKKEFFLMRTMTIFD